MAIDPTYTADTERRLQAIESALADVWRLMQYVINKEQFNRLNLAIQQSIDLIDTRLTAAETSLAALEVKYDNKL